MSQAFLLVVAASSTRKVPDAGSCKRGSSSCGDTFKVRVCFGTVCAAPSESSSSNWLAMLPTAKLSGDARNCLACKESALSRKDRFPKEVWNISRGIGQISDPRLRLSALHFASNASLLKALKRGTAPKLLDGQAISPDAHRGWRHYDSAGVPSSKGQTAPCSTSRGEDVAVLRSFFSDRRSGQALRGGFFLEAGGANGLTESNSWLLEACLGWRGVLMEGQPAQFQRLQRNRPASLNLRMAQCPTGQASGTAVSFSAQGWNGAGILVPTSQAARLSVECAHIGPMLRQYRVHRLDFVSLDVEGAEMDVLRSLIGGEDRTLSLGVVLVEVRGDGLRPLIFHHLLTAGMRYVGQFSFRGTALNAISDDVFVNMTHMLRFWPHARGASF